MSISGFPVNISIWTFYDTVFVQNIIRVHYKLRFKYVFLTFFISSELITMHKFVQIKTNIPNYVHNNISQLIHQYRYPTTLNLHKARLECTENSILNKLFEFFIIFGHIATHKFMKINTNTHHYVYNNIF